MIQQVQNMSQKISDPKNNMMQRIQDAEREAAKVEKLSKRAEKAEARESDCGPSCVLYGTLKLIREFSRRFDERVGHGTQKATEAAKEVSGKLKEEARRSLKWHLLLLQPRRRYTVEDEGR